ncbi:hypothetical protein [Flagellimonas sp. S3867]|uniref:hypothetical protein n=1 Tax=Flagellimonas sp. S3867 TaxID=2768063 RepID=UPI001CC230EF|nr:hypothetical protein [Flagellimonas sp. S3867]
MEYKKRYFESKMERYVTKGFKIFFMIVFGILFIFLMGFVFMWLWNWLMPDVFGLTTLTYWQSFGLLLLAKIIFGFGHDSSKSSGSKKSRKHEKFKRFCESKNGDADWSYYDQYWKEEGKVAFNAYVERIKSEQTDGSSEEN